MSSETNPIKLHPRHRKPQGETELVHGILRSLNCIEGVQAWRNNTGRVRDIRGIPVSFGLSIGSADIVGIVSCDYPRDGGGAVVGRFFALEVKVYGQRPSDSQERFLAVVRKMGGFAAWCTSIDEAKAALARARDPKCSGAER